MMINLVTKLRIKMMVKLSDLKQWLNLLAKPTN
jgi:hypothetical protein